MAKKIKKVTVAIVSLWGKDVGAIAWDEKRHIGQFEFFEDYLRQGINLSPIVLPLQKGIFSFPELNPKTFHGLPGFIVDALPDRYGNQLIDLWLKRNGRSLSDFSPVERLCYMGTRGMGALEFRPALVAAGKPEPVEISELILLANEILNARTQLKTKLSTSKAEALNSIIRVGTSAGGNRAKAVIAWNPKTNEVRSGQVPAPSGFEHWILKFDGIHDASLGDPVGSGRIEFAYHKMAQEAGITMAPCRLLLEGPRAHFMTKRFDRDSVNEKIHMQSLCALAHYDFNASGVYGYEHVFDTIQKLNLGHDTMQEMFRRMAFNAAARNQDDHTRNIAFLMDQDARWRLSPAFDVVWSFNPLGQWTNLHQLTINGKTDHFSKADLLSVAEQFNIKKSSDLIEQVTQAVKHWSRHAKTAGVSAKMISTIAKTHRLSLSKK